MIKDKLNLQGNTIKILKKGNTLFLETEKKLKLIVKLEYDASLEKGGKNGKS